MYPTDGFQSTVICITSFDPHNYLKIYAEKTSLFSYYPQEAEAQVREIFEQNPSTLPLRCLGSLLHGRNFNHTPTILRLEGVGAWSIQRGDS